MNLGSDAMGKTIRLIHLGSWYKCYGDDALIISFVTDYKLFEDSRTLQPTVGFPETSIDKVVDNLKANKINYILVNDSDRIYDFGDENNYLSKEILKIISMMKNYAKAVYKTVIK